MCWLHWLHVLSLEKQHFVGDVLCIQEVHSLLLVTRDMSLLGAPCGLHGSVYCDGWSGSLSSWLQGLRGSNDSISLLMGGAGSLGCWVSGGPGAGAHLLWVFWVLTRQAAWLWWFGGVLFACWCVRLFPGRLRHTQVKWNWVLGHKVWCGASPRPLGGKGHVGLAATKRAATCWWMDRAAFQRTGACRLVSGSQSRC